MNPPASASVVNSTVRPDGVPSASSDNFGASDPTLAALGDADGAVDDGGDRTHAPATAVDGNGMWRSWTRVFAKPESACLDLLDNCFDAALRPEFGGRVEMECHGPNVVSIQNNSDLPIKKLRDILTVYRSSKNSANPSGGTGDGKDSIGENGVGLKHGCAALSDCSVVLSRNKRTLEIGLIAKALQTPTGVCLPSFSFPDIGDAPRARGAARGWLTANPTIAETLGKALGPATDVRAELGRLAERLFRDGWEDDNRVFLLVLCGIRGSGRASLHDLVGGVCPAWALLRNVRAMLPESYINLPSLGDGSVFDFVVGQERVVFSHWQRRLVELSRFRVSLSANQPLEALPTEDWDRPSPNKHNLNIYCGFDAQRLREKKGTSTCALYVYSCGAGRLITREADARHLLGLSSSGVDYTQGLTVIIEDGEGRLPLTPTKDGIAWSERTNGDVHRRNLLAWTGAVAQFFWMHHRKQFESKGSLGNGPKELMRKVIQSFALDDMMEDATVSENMAHANFTEFEGIKWTRIQTKFDDHLKIRRKASKYNSLKGPDTLFSISAERIRRIKLGKKPNPTGPQNTRGGSNSEMKNAECEGHTGEYQRKSKAVGSAVPPEMVRLKDACGEDNECEVVKSNTFGGQNGEKYPNNIHRVSMGVLSYLRDKDKDKVFEMPVLEEHPEFREEYLEKVEQPMDFRTIERKSSSYTSISDLRKDLVLIFNNCIAFTGADSPYGRAAQQMLDRLDDAFEATDIPQVAMGVLAYFRDMDEREFFETPVIEENPEIKEAYLEVISNPMDFRTIEERIDSYTSIAEIRHDFVLIFQNCIQFNGVDSAFSRIAQEMLDCLDEIFENIMLGKKRRRKRINYDKLINQSDNNAKSEAPKAAPERKGAKRVSYASLQKKLRDAEKQIEQLKKRLAARDRRIMQLEEMQDCKPPAQKKPCVEFVHQGKQDSKLTASLSEEEISMEEKSISQGDNGNEDECHMCNDGGELICCDFCNKSYHAKCLQVEIENLPDPWRCPSCLKGRGNN